MKIIHYQTTEGRDVYQEWVNGLRDLKAKVAILRRVDRIALGNFGDHKPCREGVFEMRIDLGPGYRVYYFKHGAQFVLLLCGGDKGTQPADIDKAVEFKADFLRRMKESKNV